MNAADRALWRQRIESLAPLLSRFNLLLVVGVVALAWAFYLGKSNGIQTEKDREYHTALKAIVDTIKVTETKLVHDTVTMRVTRMQADTARQTFKAAEATVEAAAATSDSVSSGLVLPALHACDQAIQADTIAYRAVVVALDDMTKDRDLWEARAKLDESTRPSPPRLGVKTGFALGAGAVLAVLHFVK